MLRRTNSTIFQADTSHSDRYSAFPVILVAFPATEPRHCYGGLYHAITGVTGKYGAPMEIRTFGKSFEIP
jgi:hypothetical protein